MPEADGPWLVVAAHPDDETVGASWLVSALADVHVLHVTDGAPADRALWPPAFAGTRDGYAALRAAEARAALTGAGVPTDRIHSLGWIDQEASRDLFALAVRLQRFLEALAPAVVVSHPYEGGHPDHDATAFAVHAAARRVASRPTVLEMTSYHGAGGGLHTGAFLNDRGAVAERALSTDEQSRKRSMLACYASQAAPLAAFTIDRERFRRAPPYDFTAPPHGGALYYEQRGWRMTGALWRARAATALDALRCRAC